MAMISGSVSNNSLSQVPFTVHTPPTWNLYDNPFYSHCYSHRKEARTFWDLSGCKSSMDSDLGQARSQILELKAELKIERKARNKAESACRKLVKEVCKERNVNDELSFKYKELVKEMELTRSEINTLRREFEDELKMMKMVEDLRNEQVQMKLTEAKLLYEEKVIPAAIDKHDNPENGVTSATQRTVSVSQPPSGYKCASAEAGNPHIKQGINGFIEFPKVVKAMGSKNKVLGTRLESQRARVCILLKQKSPMKTSKLVPI